eukprot:scaffold67023_cov62-Phaeocystis_antarctica.AAC.4
MASCATAPSEARARASRRVACLVQTSSSESTASRSASRSAPASSCRSCSGASAACISHSGRHISIHSASCCASRAAPDALSCAATARRTALASAAELGLHPSSPSCGRSSTAETRAAVPSATSSASNAAALWMRCSCGQSSSSSSTRIATPTSSHPADEPCSNARRSRQGAASSKYSVAPSPGSARAVMRATRGSAEPFARSTSRTLEERSVRRCKRRGAARRRNEVSEGSSIGPIGSRAGAEVERGRQEGLRGEWSVGRFHYEHGVAHPVPQWHDGQTPKAPGK